MMPKRIHAETSKLIKMNYFKVQLEI